MPQTSAVHRPMSRFAGSLTALAVGAASVALTLGASGAPASAAASPLPALKHVWLIQLENKSYDESFVKNSNTYLWRNLPQMGVLLTQEYGTGHNSLDNYISQLSGQGPNAVTRADCPDYMDVAGGAATIVPDTGAGTVAGINAGQDMGVGCVYPKQVQTLANQLTGVGKTWHGWMGDLGNTPAREQTTCGIPATAGVADDPSAIPPGADDTQSATAADQYAGRHNPFVYFHSIIDDQVTCKANVTPLTGLAASLASETATPDFNYITPNLCDDAHDATCAGSNLGDSSTAPSTQGGLFAADEFLKKYVPMITGSPAFKDNGVLIVDFDEGDVGDTVTDPAAACCEGTGTPVVAAAGPGGGLTGEVVISPLTTPNTQSTVAYNHYSLLRSLEDGFGITTGGDDGLGHLGYAAEPVGARAASTNTTAAVSAFVPYGCDIYSAFSGCNSAAVTTPTQAAAASASATAAAQKTSASTAAVLQAAPAKPKPKATVRAIKQPQRSLAFTGLSRLIPVLAVLLLLVALVLGRRRQTRTGRMGQR